MITLCVFEDEKYKKLLPLTFTRPVFDLKCGTATLFEKIKKHYPRAVVDLMCREYLVESVKMKYTTLMVGRLTNATTTLFVNGRVLLTAEIAKKMKIEGPDEIFTYKGEVVGVRLNKQNLDLVKGKIKEIIIKDVWQTVASKIINTEISDADFISFPWDLVYSNGKEIGNDFKRFYGKKGEIEGKLYDGVQLLSKANIYVGKGAKVFPGVVLNAEEGPIIIEEGVKIFPNVCVVGPAFIGRNSALKIGAKIYENTSIGEMCKIGGEVEGSIFHSYSNKQHDGFIGHSYIGKWVNLGADTNNSDLKNNYGNVKVYIDGEMTDSGKMFVGLIIGDHSKSGINTMFNTGTVVGVSSNIFGEGFPPKFIPSFSWGGARQLVEYNFDKAKEVAQKVMARRKIEFGRAENELFKKIFELTLEERAKADVKKGKLE